MQDLTRKAKQVEYLIRALPDKEDPKQQVRLTLLNPSLARLTDLLIWCFGVQGSRLEGLQSEMKVANQEYIEAVRVAGALASPSSSADPLSDFVLFSG